MAGCGELALSICVTGRVRRHTALFLEKKRGSFRERKKGRRTSRTMLTLQASRVRKSMKDGFLRHEALFKQPPEEASHKPCQKKKKKIDGPPKACHKSVARGWVAGGSPSGLLRGGCL